MNELTRCVRLLCVTVKGVAVILGVVLSVLAVASPTGAADLHSESKNTPYWAVVTVDQAPVLSGPGPHYYSTAELPRMARVEVYREGSNGFNAIRPPEGSFSWLVASAAKTIGTTTAVVTQANVGSRIGSLLSERRDAVHVRLEEGEQLELLATENVGGVEWLQVVPPAGEFRWIRAEHLTPESEMPQPAPQPQSAPQPKPQPQALESNTPTAAVVTPAETSSESDEPTNVWAQMSVASVVDSQPVRLDPPVLEIEPSSEKEMVIIDPDVQLTSGEAPGWQSPGAVSSSPSSQPAASAPASATYPTATPPGASTFWRQLALVDVELSRRVATSPTLWQFRDLEQQAARLLQSATDAKQRQSVQQLGTRIDRFAAIANRHRMARQTAELATRTASSPATSPMLAPTSISGGQATAPPVISSPSLQPNALGISQPAPTNVAVSTTLAPRAVSPSPEASPYDSVGILRPVVSKRPNAPSYALVNEKGQVTVFITPSPDLNLSAMVGKKVGINGSRGYIREFQREHLTATRVSPVTTLR